MPMQKLVQSLIESRGKKGKEGSTKEKRNKPVLGSVEDEKLFY